MKQLVFLALSNCDPFYSGTIEGELPTSSALSYKLKLTSCDSSLLVESVLRSSYGAKKYCTPHDQMISDYNLVNTQCTRFSEIVFRAVQDASPTAPKYRTE